MSVKKAIKKKRARERKARLAMETQLVNEILKRENEAAKTQKENEIEFIPAEPEIEKLDKDSSEYKYFEKVFSRFYPDPKDSSQTENDQQLKKSEISSSQAFNNNNETENNQKETEQTEEDENDKQGLSNKMRKLRDRLSVAQLKQLVERPDLVDLHDPNSRDPMLLLLLKSTRNTVPVPEHWRDKRRYLQGKRGWEKPVFQLPKAIQDTGVSELRNTGKIASLHQKQRQRMNPKIGRLDVDYQKLHAAFFRHMEKPRMTMHGDIYYLGKENEVKYRKHRPACLSKRLKNALHIMENAPPPYLINMQRFGPPPSYPELKIPGLNAPIPSGCKYGYGDGQWGKPPVNENGYPLYGDPFGVNTSYEQDSKSMVERFSWGSVDETADYNDGMGEEENEGEAVEDRES